MSLDPALCSPCVESMRVMTLCQDEMMIAVDMCLNNHCLSMSSNSE